MLLALLASLAPAYAATCGGTVADDGTWNYGIVRGTNYAGACNYDPDDGSVTLYTFPGCNTGTPAGDTLRISDAGTSSWTGIIAPVVRGTGITCGAATIDPWPATFAFGLFSTGYGGDDIIHGTPNHDELYSNGTPLAYAADNNAVEDALCGFSGNDTLQGDQGSAVGVCLNGGLGNDTCTVSGLFYHVDTVLSCETVVNTPHFAGNESCGCTATDFWPL